MSNYRNNIRNMYGETRFSIPFNNTSIKRRLLINKLGLSQEIESALACSSTNRNCKTKTGNNHNKLTIPPKIITKYKNNVIPYDKTYNSDIDENATVCNESSISFSSRINSRSPTPDHGEELPSFALSPILRKGNMVLMRSTTDESDIDDETEDITLCLSSDNNENIYDEHSFVIRKPNVNVVRKAKSLYTEPIMDGFDFFSDYKVVKEEDKKINEELTEVNTVNDDDQVKPTTINNEKEKDTIKESNPSHLDEYEIHDKEGIVEKSTLEEQVLSTDTKTDIVKISPQYMEPDTGEDDEEDINSHPKKEIEEEKNYEKEIHINKTEEPTSVNNDTEMDIPSTIEDQQSETEQMILQFVAFDEQEKTRLQQAIIDQTTQRLNEKQQEADRLTNKISQQKAKLEEHKARQRHLSQELELKRRQSAELRTKLTSQFEKNQQQRKELNYYKEMNSKYMKVNRQLQEQIRELTKLKYLKV